MREVRNPQLAYMHLPERRPPCSTLSRTERQARQVGGPWSPAEALRIASMPKGKRSDPRKLATMKAKHAARMSA